MPVTISGVQYSGVWTMQQVNAAVAAGTWPTQPDLRLLSWGFGQNGRLGLGNTTSYSSPKQVGSLTTWYKLSMKGNVLAIKTDGTLWSWGRNGNGQLGLGNITEYSSPKQVGALTNWSKVATKGNTFSLATKTDGTLWSWGQNDSGQLGLGNLTNYSSPKQVGSLTNWANIASEESNPFSLATKTDGTLWSWGANVFGQLGLGNAVDRSSPNQVGALTSWLNVATCYGSSIATKTDGTLWSWGYNFFGSLGLGNTTTYSSPKQVGALTTWLNIAGGRYQIVAVKTDGTLWNWGQNNFGQLGDGTIVSKSSPVQVGSLTTWLTPSGGRDFSISL